MNRTTGLLGALLMTTLASAPLYAHQSAHGYPYGGGWSGSISIGSGPYSGIGYSGTINYHSGYPGPAPYHGAYWYPSCSHWHPRGYTPPRHHSHGRGHGYSHYAPPGHVKHAYKKGYRTGYRQGKHDRHGHYDD